MAQSRIEIKRKKNRKLRRGAKLALLVFLTTILLVGGGFAYVVQKFASVTAGAQQDLDRGDRSDYRDDLVNPDKDPISILFLGLDSLEGDLSGRTDALVVATFNPEEKTIKMVNIPRDSQVEIPGRKYKDKINHAHAFGGVDMTINTVENLLDIPIDYFVSLNFDAFMEIIDALDGVTVNVERSFTEKDIETYGTITINEGEQRLNGQEALAYVRMRKSDPRGDLGRGDRQKEVITAIVKEAASFSSITKFNPLMDSVGSNLKTNINFSNMVSMHTYASKLDDVESLSFEGDNHTENGVYYYKLRPESVQEISNIFKKHLNITNSETE